MPGEFLVKVSDLSLAKLMGIITTQLEPVSNQLSDLVTTVNDLSGTVDTHTQQIGQLQSQVVGLDNRITSESAATAKQLRSEEHTSELQSLMRISYAVFCLKKKKAQ